jgi:hypothetical protein
MRRPILCVALMAVLAGLCSFAPVSAEPLSARRGDGARRNSPGVLIEIPHL